MRAIILRTIPYQENAKLIYAYTPYGLKSAVARGVLKMNSPLKLAADPFKLLDIELSDKALPTLKSVKLVAHYPNTKANYEKTLLPHIIGETILKNVTDDDDHPKLFSLLVKTFEGIEHAEDGFDFLAMFMLKVLYFLGFGLKLGACHICGAQDGLGFDLKNHQTLCVAHGANASDQAWHEQLTAWLKADALDYHASPRDLTFKRQVFALVRTLYQDALDFNARSFQMYQNYLKETP